MRSGPRNLITDVAGLRVGNAQDTQIKTGVSVLTADQPFTAAVHVMGGAPGTRETDLLAPDKTVQQVDAIVLSGGSAFGLQAASGICDALAEQGRGFAVGPHHVPIVPSAILFDLINGGDKEWAKNPYAQMGRDALAAAGQDFEIGTFGAGTGATTATLKGGLGSASVQVGPHTIGALVAVNALGSAIVGDGPHFWAAPFEMDAEFGGRGISTQLQTGLPPTKLDTHRNTTIAIVATDAALDQAQCTRMAISAHDGMARALVPSHTPMDGDLVFGASTGAVPLGDPGLDTLVLGHLAAACLSRAIARAIYAATPAADDPYPTWQDQFGA